MDSKQNDPERAVINSTSGITCRTVIGIIVLRTMKMK